MGSRPEQTFLQKDIWTARRHLKRCLTPQIIGGMPIKPLGDTTSHLSEQLSSKRQLRVLLRMWDKGVSCTVGGTVN